MRLIPLIISLIFISHFSLAQQKFWIYFNEKGEQIKELDEPVNPTYLKIIQNMDIEVENQSNWLNAISAYLTTEDKVCLESLDFIAEIDRVSEFEYNYHSTNPVELNFSHALEQINAMAFLEEGLSGKNVRIGIIDGGFQGALENQSLKKIIDEGRIIKTRDYLADKDLLRGSEESSKDWHGTAVWQFIAGSDPKIRSGLAKDAVFYLARTEHGDNEFRGEEDNWIAAIEWLHGEGVRLVNSSLGYSTGFNDPDENYRPEQMDGKTTAISRAAQIAVEKKGMILVVSAGNDGNDSKWEVMTAPADAQAVISVGSTVMDTWTKAGYSAIGADFVNFLKPNIACYSGSGTSFSAPVITGIIACMIEKDSTISNKRVQEILQTSGHLYPFGNNYLGYGVPDCQKIVDQMNDLELNFDNSRLVRSKNNYFQIDCEKEDVVLFHKKDKLNILFQKTIQSKMGRVIIHRPKDAMFTTVHYGKEVIEIQWK